MTHGLLRRHGIHLLAIQTPFPIGRVNSWFVEGAVPTLIDVPPDGAQFLIELENKLNNLGFRLEDVKRIVVTHPHIDHFGSAAAVARVSGAEVWVSGEGAAWLEHYEDELAEEHLFAQDFLTRAGIPPERIDKTLPRFFRPALALAQSVKPTRYLKQGDEVILGQALFQFVAVPGHTPWCMLIYDGRDRIAFTGDFLLKEVSSNALCQRPHAVSHGYKSLKAYVASLEKVKEMDLKLALPGHGGVIENVSERIEELLTFIGERKRLIYDVVAAGAETPFHIMNRVFPELHDNELFLAISEIMGHLEVLEEEHLVERHQEQHSTIAFRVSKGLTS